MLYFRPQVNWGDPLHGGLLQSIGQGYRITVQWAKGIVFSLPLGKTSTPRGCNGRALGDQPGLQERGSALRERRFGRKMEGKGERLCPQYRIAKGLARKHSEQRLRSHVLLSATKLGPPSHKSLQHVLLPSTVKFTITQLMISMDSGASRTSVDLNHFHCPTAAAAGLKLGFT